MADQKKSYGVAGQSIIISLGSLGSGNARESDVIDNSSAKALDCLAGGKIRFVTAAPGQTNRRVEIYVYGTADGGTTYTGGATGSDAAFTFPMGAIWPRTVLRLLGAVPWISAGGNIKEFGPFSVAAAFNGVVPEKWGIIVWNLSGAALHTTAGEHVITYQNIYEQIS